MENWIFAKKIDGEFVKVRQSKAGSGEFVGVDGNIYTVYDLDFTQIHPLDADLLRQFEESNKRYAEQQVEYQELLNKMLSSMDANAIADHKAEIDEREYWRKLRGDIALEIIRKRGSLNHYCNATHYDVIAEMANVLFMELYAQDKDFFKDK